MTWSRWRRVRQLAQYLSLALFIYLLLAALQRRAVFPLADLFFRLDPLVAISAMLASRQWIARLLPEVLIVVLTLAFGRVWCGWLCPLGTVLDLVRFRRPWQSDNRPRWLATHEIAWRQAKYLLLFLILGAAFLGSLSLLIFDPITILTRTMTTTILPTLNRLITGINSALYTIRPLRGVVNALEGVLRGRVLPVRQGVFLQSVLIGALFAGLIVLNSVAHRFWCRYLCPLGAMLALLSRLSILRRRVAPACSNCAVCAAVCDVEAIHPEKGYESDPAECTVCLDCLAACPQSGIEFRAHLQPAPAQPYDPSRRQFLASIVGAAVGVTLLSGEASRALPHPKLVRPPGAQRESDFLSRCVRCSQCMKVCPTSGLQPCLGEAGLSGIWTPRLVPRLGYCDYSCNACGQICPTGAIPLLTLTEKRQVAIGKAYVDHDRCLPWADGIPCIVCEEMCPVPNKAIRLTEETALNAAGEAVTVQRPHVERELCIGCGICEYQCPVEGQAAIQVWRG